jgi:hypothetical protein
MITMLVWVLVAVGGANGQLTTYSPALPTEAECLRVKEDIKKSSGRSVHSVCIQMTIVK